MTKNIAYMLLTCSRERSRYDTLKTVVDNIRQHPNFKELDSDLLVFDNASTYEGAKELLHSSFSHVVDSQDNYGYWGAIGWVVRNHARVLGKSYEYLYLIESDQIHYDWPALDKVEEFLDKHTEIDSMRVREFSVSEAHLYDKEKHLPESRRWAWCTQKNPFTGQRVTFQKSNDYDDVYVTNFTTLPPSVNRMSLMNIAFDHLECLDRFTEKDFWEACWRQNPNVALLDNGICHAKLGYARDVVSSHYTTTDVLIKNGYVKCEESLKLDLKGMKVDF